VLEVLRVQRVLEVLVLKVLRVLEALRLQLRLLKKVAAAEDVDAAVRRRRRWRPA
jgi:hypothetical protein